MYQLISLAFIVAILCIPGNFAFKRNYDFKIGNHENLKMFEDKCFEVTKSETAYENLMNAAQSYEICIKSLFDSSFVQEIQRDFELENFDAIIKKVCDKKEKILNCFNSFMDVVSICLADKEKFELKTINRILESLAGFTCENMNQTTIVMTYECVESKQEQIMTCLEQNYGILNTLKPNDYEEIDAIKSRILTCPVFKNFEDCVINELKSCDEDIPAKIFNSIFEIVKHEVPCN